MSRAESRPRGSDVRTSVVRSLMAWVPWSRRTSDRVPDDLVEDQRAGDEQEGDDRVAVTVTRVRTDQEDGDPTVPRLRTPVPSPSGAHGGAAPLAVPGG